MGVVIRLSEGEAVEAAETRLIYAAPRTIWAGPVSADRWGPNGWTGKVREKTTDGTFWHNYSITYRMGAVEAWVKTRTRHPRKMSLSVASALAPRPPIAEIFGFVAAEFGWSLDQIDLSDPALDPEPETQEVPRA